MNAPVLLTLLADAGIPMIALTLPLMLLLLVPVVGIEALLYRKWLQLKTWEAIKSSAASNVASTVVGIPLAWLLMFVLELGMFGLIASSKTIQNWRSPIAEIVSLLLGSAWIGPPEGKNVWMIPAATLVLLIPFFFVSYVIEYFIVVFVLHILHPVTHPAYTHVRRAVRNANLTTYGAMFISTVVWLLVSLAH